MTKVIYLCLKMYFALRLRWGSSSAWYWILKRNSRTSRMTMCGVQQILSPKSKNKIEQKFQKQPFKDSGKWLKSIRQITKLLFKSIYWKSISNGVVKVFENYLFHKSNEKTGKNCQKQLFFEIWKLNKSFQQSRKHLLKKIRWGRLDGSIG